MCWGLWSCKKPQRQSACAVRNPLHQCRTRSTIVPLKGPINLACSCLLVSLLLWLTFLSHAGLCLRARVPRLLQQPSMRALLVEASCGCLVWVWWRLHSQTVEQLQGFCPLLPMFLRTRKASRPACEGCEDHTLGCVQCDRLANSMASEATNDKFQLWALHVPDRPRVSDSLTQHMSPQQPAKP